jgi:hypothetical protein
MERVPRFLDEDVVIDVIDDDGDDGDNLHNFLLYIWFGVCSCMFLLCCQTLCRCWSSAAQVGAAVSFEVEEHQGKTTSSAERRLMLMKAFETTKKVSR